MTLLRAFEVALWMYAGAGVGVLATQVLTDDEAMLKLGRKHGHSLMFLAALAMVAVWPLAILWARRHTSEKAAKAQAASSREKERQ